MASERSLYRRRMFAWLAAGFVAALAHGWVERPHAPFSGVLFGLAFWAAYYAGTNSGKLIAISCGATWEVTDGE